MKMKKIISVFTLAAASASLLTGCEGTKTNSDESSSTSGSTVSVAENVEIHNFIMPEIGEKIAVINVKDYGAIKIKLFPEDAEKGVENFVGLAEMGYYDEIIFHRIIPNFMNQGGDPKGNGTGGKSIWGTEFDGGTDENLYHFTGAVAYANSGSTSTNGSQFYIVNTPDGYMEYSCEELMAMDPSYYWPENVIEKYKEVGGVPFLDGGYTVFGQVFEGMDVVRAMAEVETNPENDKPLTQVMMENIEIVEYTGN